MTRKSIIRARQPGITRISPHAGNKVYLVPNRRQLGAGGGVVPGTFTMTAGDNGTTSNGYRRAALAPPNDAYGVIDSGDINFNGNDATDVHTEGPGGQERWTIGFFGTSLPNDDATWASVSITGIFTGGLATKVLTRSALTYAPSSGGNTVWRGATSSETSFIISGNAYDVVFS